ncbi:hypothetical protein DKX38_027173 [Salix brachista]|uniref:C-JID domain-containing protein n=1 Tax=Salix brachista TaxID=2182728 RepID=A0A5N5JGM6_9ROSI|nr:hypothetical protein DKX38_027173 [Salix brachista]
MQKLDADSKGRGKAEETKKNMNEPESIKMIVEYILYKLSITMPTISKNLVGIDSRLEVLNGYIGEQVGEAIFIGVCGMGGIGKTTVARGKEKIEAIFLDMPGITEAQWNMKAFSKMSKLRLLKINNVQLSEGPGDLINKLRFLEWHFYPSKSLQACLQVDVLVELHMPNSSIEQLWSIEHEQLQEAYKDSKKHRITVLPSLSGLFSLEVLSLRDCNLREGALPEHIGCLSSLMSLDLSRNDFVSLPRSINKLSGLQMLVLEDCRMLESLPEVPSKVQTVNLNGCISLKEIPDPIKLSSSKRSEFLCLNCWELYTHNDQDNMGFTMLERYLQGLSNPRPGFGVVVPGNEIPGWFNYQKKGSSINVQVHSWSMGFVACVAFNASGESPSLFCHFKANGRENYSSLMGISCNSIEVLSDHLWLFYLSFDYLKELTEWQHESFNNIELSFHSSERVKVKNYGVFLLYSPHTPPLPSKFDGIQLDIPDIRDADTSNAFTHLSIASALRGIIPDDKELEKHRGSTNDGESPLHLAAEPTGPASREVPAVPAPPAPQAAAPAVPAVPAPRADAPAVPAPPADAPAVPAVPLLPAPRAAAPAVPARIVD